MDRETSGARWTARATRALLLGLGLAVALALAGLALAAATGRAFLRSVIWAEFAGGTAVCGLAALLLLWRPAEPGRTEERERTADVGFGLMLAGSLAVAAGLLLSWVWRV